MKVLVNGFAKGTLFKGKLEILLMGNLGKELSSLKWFYLLIIIVDFQNLVFLMKMLAFFGKMLLLII
jgi:hypothetical protein